MITDRAGLAAPIIDFDVNRDDHALAWQDAFGKLKETIAKELKGTHEPVDILAMLHEGLLFLWPGDKAAAVTEIVTYPRKTTCNVFLAGGRGGMAEIRRWCARGGPLEHWAFGQWDCDWITYTGRNGWSRVIDCEPFGEVAMRMRSSNG